MGGGGGPVGIVKSVATAAASVVTAPVQAVGDIVSGKNVGDTIINRGSQVITGQFVSQAGVAGAAGATYTPPAAQSLPIVSNVSTAYGAANQIVGGNFGKDEMLNFYRNYAEGAALAGTVAGGIALASGSSAEVVGAGGLETVSVTAPVTEGVGIPIAADVTGETLAEATIFPAIETAGGEAAAAGSSGILGSGITATQLGTGAAGALGVDALVNQGKKEATKAVAGLLGFGSDTSPQAPKLAGVPKGAPSGNAPASGSAQLPGGTAQAAAILGIIALGATLIRR